MYPHAMFSCTTRQFREDIFAFDFNIHLKESDPVALASILRQNSRIYIELAFCCTITEKVVDEISGCLPRLVRVYSAVNIPFMRSTIFKAFSRHARSSSARLLIDGRSCPDIAHYLARNYGRQTVKKIKKFFGTNTNRPTVTLDWFGFS